MGRLKQTRSSVGHSFVEFVETDTRRGPVVRERVVPSNPLKRRASTSPSKTRNSTPSFGDHSYVQDDDPQTPKRVRVGQKVSTLQQLHNLGNNQQTESKRLLEGMDGVQKSLRLRNSCIGGPSGGQPMLFLSIGAGDIPVHGLYQGSTGLLGMLLQAASFGPLPSY